MTFGIIIGINRGGDGEPVILAGPARLSKIREMLPALRKSAEGSKFSRIQVWTNQALDADHKLKAGEVLTESAPAEPAEPAPEGEPAPAVRKRKLSAK